MEAKAEKLMHSKNILLDIQDLHVHFKMEAIRLQHGNVTSFNEARDGVLSLKGVEDN